MNQRNLGASVRQRLLNKAHAEKRPFQELLQYYAMERFLYRLAQSPHAKSFALKGLIRPRILSGRRFCAAVVSIPLPKR
jgi:hypothetical protein